MGRKTMGQVTKERYKIEAQTAKAKAKAEAKAIKEREKAIKERVKAKAKAKPVKAPEVEPLPKQNMAMTMEELVYGVARYGGQQFFTPNSRAICFRLVLGVVITCRLIHFRVCPR